VQLGPEGVAKINGLGPLSDYEKQALDAMIPELKTQIEKGVAFAKQ
jgi:malate dehydrogenase